MITLELLSAPPPLLEVNTTVVAVEFVSEGIQGPKGLKGEKGDPGQSVGSLITRVAGESVGGHKAARVDAQGLAWLADNRRDSDVVGIFTGAAALDAAATIQTAGEMVEPTWNWAAGPVWLGTDGQLTQAPPVAANLVQMGIAAGSTSLIVEPRLIAAM
jgi:hypothetical protein